MKLSGNQFTYADRVEMRVKDMHTKLMITPTQEDMRSGAGSRVFEKPPFKTEMLIFFARQITTDRCWGWSRPLWQVS